MQIARESIFVSSLRGFFRCFFSVFGILLGLIGASLVYSTLIPMKTYEEKTEFSFLPDLEGHHQILPTSTPAILQIPIHGVIGDVHGLKAEGIENILLDSRSGLLSNNRVKGILLHIHTPGGGVSDCDTIYRLIKDYKAKYQVPVFTFINGLCASGGMYIAASSDQIFATPPSIIGSIGVIMGPFFNVAETMAKIGMSSTTLSAGLDKDAMNPFRSWKTDEDASLKALVSFAYRQFVDILTMNRSKIDKTKLINEYGAQVFDVVKAAEIGYIDVANASYQQALAALLQTAQIDPSQPYQIVELKPRTNWVDALLNNQSTLFTGKIEHQFSCKGFNSHQLQDPIAYLYEPGQAYR